MKISLTIWFIFFSFVTQGFNNEVTPVDTIIIDQDFIDVKDLGDHMNIFIDSTNRGLASILSKSSLDFIPLNEKGIVEIDEAYKNNYWMKFCIENKTERELHLLFRLRSFHESRLYFIEDNRVDSIIGGDRLASSKRPFWDHEYLPLSRMDKKESICLYFHPKPVRNTIRPADYQIQTYDYGFKWYNRNILPRKYLSYLFHGVFYGFLLFIAIFSFIQYLLEKDTAYAVYVLYLLAAMTFFMIRRSRYHITFFQNILRKPISSVMLLDI